MTTVKHALAIDIGADEAHEPSLADCFAHTDLEWRLAQVPSDAAVRGVFFNMLDASAARRGAGVHRAYRDFFRTWQFSPIRFYPVRDYLTRLVLLAQVAFGAERIMGGVFALQSGAYAAWRNTLLGRAMFSVLRSDLGLALATTERAYATRAVTSYSDFYVTRLAPERFRTVFRGEYVYIAEAMAGALVGMGRALGHDVEAQTRLETPFEGEVLLTIRGPYLENDAREGVG